MMSMPSFVIPKGPDQEFWETIFQELMAGSHDPQDAARYADEALIEWRKRWPSRQIEAQQLQIIPGYREPCIGIDQLVRAQKDLEAAQQQLDAIKNLADAMPDPELGKAYFAVEGLNAEKRVEAAQEWVQNVQNMIQKQEREKQ